MSERENRHAARTTRLFVDAELGPRASIELPEDAAHHAARVLRLAAGDRVVLFDGRGGEYEATLAMPGRGRVLAQTGDWRELERESPLAVTLVQAVSSGERMDFTIQKAVELGVAAIQPVYSERSIVRLAGEREAKKLAHWRRVAISACEQCGRNRVPAIAEPLALERYRAPEGSKILLAPAATRRLVELAKHHLTHASDPLSLAAGPEGGFSEAEEAQLQRDGFVAASLGPRVLRTETAALAALAALNALAGDF
jgi:16S rRNA (uracil1498-N3)-methyltransferase